MGKRSCRPRHEPAASTSVTKHGPAGPCLGRPELVTWTMASGSSVRSAGWGPSRPPPSAVRGTPAPTPAARQPTESIGSSSKMKQDRRTPTTRAEPLPAMALECTGVRASWSAPLLAAHIAGRRAPMARKAPLCRWPFQASPAVRAPAAYDPTSGRCRNSTESGTSSRQHPCGSNSLMN
jgi:hypothetical protein